MATFCARRAAQSGILREINALEASMVTKPKVLFLSKGNAVRSQMAEGFLRSFAGDHFETASAGTESTTINPLAVEVMAEDGIDISKRRSKTVRELFQDYFAYVITFYDGAKERSPIFPFTTNLLRWNLIDPGSAQGSGEEKKRTFRSVRDQIEMNIREFLQQVSDKERRSVWQRRVAGLDASRGPQTLPPTPNIGSAG
jgi:arsenate reductase (thioredoxin)